MRIALLVLLLVVLAGPAAAQDVFKEGTTVTIKLMNGDTLTGILEEADEAKLVIHHDILGRIEIARAAIAPTPPQAEVEPVSPWSGKFDLSLTGAEGNTDNQNFRTELAVKHDTERLLDTFDVWYRRESEDNDATEEKTFSLLRREWKVADTKWRPFVQGTYERDIFTDYDGRAAVAGGGSYQFRDDGVAKLAGRVGLGYSRKFGNDDPDVDDGAYEGLLGFDWFWNISTLSTFSLTADYYPNLSDTGEFRSITRAAYERKIDETSPWFVKVGADNFHDSEPGGDDSQNDWNYYVGLGRTF